MWQSKLTINLFHKTLKSLRGKSVKLSSIIPKIMEIFYLPQNKKLFSPQNFFLKDFYLRIFIKLLLLYFTGVLTDKISLFETKFNVFTVNACR